MDERLKYTLLILALWFFATNSSGITIGNSRSYSPQFSQPESNQ